MFSQLLFACSIEIADARELDWKMYGVGAASTALSMPLTYVGASLLTKTSNKLVTGMLPPVLFGIAVPASSSHFSMKYYGNRHGYELSRPGLTFGSTVACNTMLFAGGSALGVSRNHFGEVVGYTLISAALLPLPTWLMSKQENSTISISVLPLEGDLFWSGGYGVAF